MWLFHVAKNHIMILHIGVSSHIASLLGNAIASSLVMWEAFTSRFFMRGRHHKLIVYAGVQLHIDSLLCGGVITYGFLMWGGLQLQIPYVGRASRKDSLSQEGTTMILYVGLPLHTCGEVIHTRISLWGSHYIQIPYLGRACT